MFFAVVIKDPNKAEEENEQESNELNPDEEALHSQKKNSEEEKTLRKIGFVDKPPNPEKLEAARMLKVKQKEMKTIIREVIQYFVFLSVLLVIAYGSRDPMAFTVTRAMRDMFDEAKYSGNSAFEEVRAIIFRTLAKISEEVPKIIGSHRKDVKIVSLWGACVYFTLLNFWMYI